MYQGRILVVEDEPSIAEVVSLYLQRAGYQVTVVGDGQAALDALARQLPDLVVLDLMLPMVDGLEITHWLRERGDTPIIMLTARREERDRIAGLEMGADDYVVKPFSPQELVSRVRAVLRRVSEEEDNGPPQVRFGNLVVDFVRHQVTVRGKPVHLTLKEFKLLEVLIKEPGRAFSRWDLLDRVFGFDSDVLERTVDTHVMNLRKKIEPDPGQPTYILTVYGVGYKFTEDQHAA